MKFKKGDKVIHVGNNWHYGVLEKLTIEGHYISNAEYDCYWTKENRGEPILESEIEFEYIVNSPLYKALE